MQSQTIGEISLRASNGVRESKYVFKHQDSQYITMMTVKWGRKATHKEGESPASFGFQYLLVSRGLTLPFKVGKGIAN